MDGARFDDLVRELLAGGAPRRLLLRLSALPLAGGFAAFLLDDDESAARKRKRKNKRTTKKRKKRRDQARDIAAEGPCGDGSGPDNRCTKDQQCCTRHCDKKKRRCRCLKEGQQCNNDRFCCPGRTGRTCQGGVCQSALPCSSSCPGCCDGQGGCQPGTSDDACGTSGAACVACPGEATCGGDLPGVCGDCVPTTCQAEGAACGTIPDGCGGTLACGACPADQVCWENACVCGDVCGDGCQFQSIQEAIFAADAGATIRLCAEQYQETIVIDKNLILLGAGEDATVLQGDSSGTVVTITAGTVRIENLRVTGGTGDRGGGISNAAGATLNLTGCAVTENTCEVFGGGIYNLGTLTVEDCTISVNTYDFGELWGGGIYSEGTLSVTNSDLIGNQARAGGALYAETSGPVTLTGCDLSDNHTFDGLGVATGGALDLSSAAGVEVTDCTIRDNTTMGYGGGAYVPSSTVVFTNCDISGNSAQTGGGISNGGISDDGSDLTLDNTDVTGNSAVSSSGGGGIFNGSNSTVSCTNGSTVSGNTGGDCVDAGGSGCATCVP